MVRAARCLATLDEAGADASKLLCRDAVPEVVGKPVYLGTLWLVGNPLPQEGCAPDFGANDRATQVRHVGRRDFAETLGLAVDIGGIVQRRLVVITGHAGVHAIGGDLHDVGVICAGSDREEVGECAVDLHRALARSNVALINVGLGDADRVDDESWIPSGGQRGGDVVCSHIKSRARGGCVLQWGVSPRGCAPRESGCTQFASNRIAEHSCYAEHEYVSHGSRVAGGASAALSTCDHARRVSQVSTD